MVIPLLAACINDHNFDILVQILTGPGILQMRVATLYCFVHAQLVFKVCTTNLVDQSNKPGRVCTISNTWAFLLPHAHGQGIKQLVCPSVVVRHTKIPKSRDLGVLASDQ